MTTLLWVQVGACLLPKQHDCWPTHAGFAHVVCWSAWLVLAEQQLVRPLPCMAAGYFEVMFTQQVASYNQDLGVTTTAPMQMNWLLRSEAYAWYFLPPISSILVLWWYENCLTMLLVFCLYVPLRSAFSHCHYSLLRAMHLMWTHSHLNHDSKCCDTQGKQLSRCIVQNLFCDMFQS